MERDIEKVAPRDQLSLKVLEVEGCSYSHDCVFFCVPYDNNLYHLFVLVSVF